MRARTTIAVLAAAAAGALSSAPAASASATLYPTVYDFGAVALGSEQTKDFSLVTGCDENYATLPRDCLNPGGDGDLPISISVTGGMSEVDNCPDEMPRADQYVACTIRLTFSPAAAVQVQATLATGDPLEGAPTGMVTGSGSLPVVKKPAKRKCAKKHGKKAKKKKKRCKKKKT